MAITFFIVSGGAYGLETAVGAIGAGWTFLLTALLPFLWVVPTVLMVSELSSMMPEQGGYYVWVHKGLGRFWGFQEGWWTICYSAVDLAIYPVLFVTYLSFFWPALGAHPEAGISLQKWAIGSVFVFCALLLNLRGSRWVGLHKVLEIAVVTAPFVIFMGIGLFKGDWHLPKQALMDVFSGSHSVTSAQLAAGLAILIWNYTGWDNATTYAGEIHDADKTIPKAMKLAFFFVVASYVLPLIIGFKVTTTAKDWAETSGWPEIGLRLAGPWLGVLIAVAAIISSWALFNSQLLYISRLPAVMAKDGLLPKKFSEINPHTGVPTFALIVSAIVAALLCGFSLGKIVIIDIMLYSLGLSLEFIALIRLRVTQPQAQRLFRIPLPTWGLVLMSLMPLSIALIVALSSVFGDGGSFMQVGIAAIAVIIGLVYYKAVLCKTKTTHS